MLLHVALACNMRKDTDDKRLFVGVTRFLCVCVCVCEYICIYMCACVPVRVRIYIYIYIHVYSKSKNKSSVRMSPNPMLKSVFGYIKVSICQKAWLLRT